eukprot:TRINITY_DN6839_c0_g1_i1.p1 TRINITY_DN6839_c0_g1~~TRINITY_DN6839_c0_g1_i1.p1  ORF type:complete len:1155 (+),score=281.63 TRINITY_DN6839_c0_g1_i1:502-3465(+)
MFLPESSISKLKPVPSIKNIYTPVTTQKSKYDYGVLENFFQMKYRLSEENYKELLRLMELYNMDIIDKEDILVCGLDVIDEESQDFLHKFMNVNLEELLMETETKDYIDLSSRKLLGASYRDAADILQAQVCTGRGEHENKILNNEWIQAPKESERYFTNRSISQYEQTIFDMEDNILEWHLHMEWIENIIATFEFYSQNTNTQLPFLMPNYCKDVINSLYGEQAEVIMNNLKRSPMAIIPIILPRLKQKREDWLIEKKNAESSWKKAQFQNYYYMLNIKENESGPMMWRNYEKKINKYFSDTWFMSLELEDFHIVRDCAIIISHVFAENELGDREKEIFDEVFKVFLDCFFLKESSIKFQPTIIGGETQNTDSSCSDSVYGDGSLFSFFKLFHLLYKKIQLAHKIANTNIIKSNPNPVDPPRVRKELKREERYPAFVNGLITHLNNLNSEEYLQFIVDTLGVKGYELLFIDNIISALKNAVLKLIIYKHNTTLLEKYIYDFNNFQQAEFDPFSILVYNRNSFSATYDEACGLLEIELHIQESEAVSDEGSRRPRKKRRFIDDFLPESDKQIEREIRLKEAQRRYEELIKQKVEMEVDNVKDEEEIHYDSNIDISDSVTGNSGFMNHTDDTNDASNITLSEENIVPQDTTDLNMDVVKSESPPTMANTSNAIKDEVVPCDTMKVDETLKEQEGGSYTNVSAPNTGFESGNLQENVGIEDIPIENVGVEEEIQDINSNTSATGNPSTNPPVVTPHTDFTSGMTLINTPTEQKLDVKTEGMSTETHLENNGNAPAHQNISEKITSVPRNAIELVPIIRKEESNLRAGGYQENLQSSNQVQIHYDTSNMQQTGLPNQETWNQGTISENMAVSSQAENTAPQHEIQNKYTSTDTLVSGFMPPVVHPQYTSYLPTDPGSAIGNEYGINPAYQWMPSANPQYPSYMQPEGINPYNGNYYHPDSMVHGQYSLPTVQSTYNYNQNIPSENDKGNP